MLTKIASTSLAIAILHNLTACTPAQIKEPLGLVAPSGLTREQAQKILISALNNQGYQLNKAGVFIDGDLTDEEGNPPHPGYFDFSLGYDGPTSGATEYWGLFSVSRLTGDVWEINTCKRLESRVLQGLQESVMAKTGKTMAEETTQRKGLGCTDEQ